MAKTATFAVRLDEDLKSEAQSVLEGMGIPMSLAVEMFLRQVVSKKKLPFAIGEEGPSLEEIEKREEEEKCFWQEFIRWYFRAWPHFDDEEIARRAKQDFGFEGKSIGRVAELYIQGDARAAGHRMTPEQYAAYCDLETALSLLSDAKELIYWALGMERVFVPSLSARFYGDADVWRYRLAKNRGYGYFGDPDEDLLEDELGEGDDE